MRPTDLLLLALAVVGCGSNATSGAADGSNNARGPTPTGSGSATDAPPGATPGSVVSTAPSGTTTGSAAGPVGSTAPSTAAATSVCAPFGAKFSRVGTFCHGVALFAPTSKAALPPALKWKPCVTDDPRRGGVLPAGCEALDASAWYPSDVSRNPALPVLEFANDAPRISMQMIYPGCSMWGVVAADGAAISAATFVGHIEGMKNTAGEGTSWVGMTVTQSSDPTAGGDTYSCYFVANEDASPPGTKIEEFATSQAWVPDSLGAKLFADGDSITSFPSSEKRVPAARSVAVVGDVVVRLQKSKIDLSTADGQSTTLVDAKPGDELVTVAASSKWIVWTLARGTDTVLVASPFARTAADVHATELGTWPTPPPPKYLVPAKAPLLGPDHVIASGQLYRLTDGARWRLPFLDRVHGGGDLPTALGVTATHVFWTDVEILRTPLTSLGDPAAKP